VAATLSALTRLGPVTELERCDGMSDYEKTNDHETPNAHGIVSDFAAESRRGTNRRGERLPEVKGFEDGPATREVQTTA
jgi:hypothetical protein